MSDLLDVIAEVVMWAFWIVVGLLGTVAFALLVRHCWSIAAILTFVVAVCWADHRLNTSRHQR